MKKKTENEYRDIFFRINCGKQIIERNCISEGVEIVIHA